MEQIKQNTPQRKKENNLDHFTPEKSKNKDRPNLK